MKVQSNQVEETVDVAAEEVVEEQQEPNLLLLGLILIMVGGKNWYFVEPKKYQLMRKK